MPLCKALFVKKYDKYKKQDISTRRGVSYFFAIPENLPGGETVRIHREKKFSSVGVTMGCSIARECRCLSEFP